MSNDLLTVRETSQRLNLREGTVRLWLAQRRLPFVRCGRAIRIPAEAVEEFIRSNTIPARDLRIGRDKVTQPARGGAAR